MKSFFNLIRNINLDMAKIEAERIIKAHPENETDLKKMLLNSVKRISLIFFGDLACAGELIKDLQIIFPKK